MDILSSLRLRKFGEPIDPIFANQPVEEPPPDEGDAGENAGMHPGVVMEKKDLD